MAVFVVVLVAVLGIAYGFIAYRSFTLEYAFMVNFVVAAVMIAGGLLLPAVPKRLVDKLRSKQLFEYKMHMEYMEERAKRQVEGYHVMWIGFASGAITGLVEILLWAFL